jgi:hypothetical protein
VIVCYVWGYAAFFWAELKLSCIVLVSMFWPLVHSDSDRHSISNTHNQSFSNWSALFLFLSALLLPCCSLSQSGNFFLLGLWILKIISDCLSLLCTDFRCNKQQQKRGRLRCTCSTEYQQSLVGTHIVDAIERFVVTVEQGNFHTFGVLVELSVSTR